MSTHFRFFLAGILFFSITASAQPRQGMPADEIALPSATGDTIRLSSLKGKVVLVDFWASWCLPCRMTNARYRKVYSKFKDKGFEILGVSFDDRNEPWQKAVEKDKITWLQVIDHGGIEAGTAYRWNVPSIPTSYLVDQNGTLLAMDPDSKQLAKALKQLLDK